MGNLLLVEDDANLAMGLEYALKGEGHAVCVAGTCEAARHFMQSQGFSLYLLDVMLPDGTGYDLLKEIRGQTQAPALFLTACDEEVHVVMGLDLGADDYVTKPFRVQELLSRIRAVLRRAEGVGHPSPVIAGTAESMGKGGNAWGAGTARLVSGDIELLPLEGRARRAGADLFLTPVEYRLLLTLMNHPGQVMTRQALLEGIWDVDGNFIEDNALSVYIRRLREKIGDQAGLHGHIMTVRGLGYRWESGVSAP